MRKGETERGDGAAEGGLRERKKLRTRETIVSVSFELFAERGFEGTTVADIADAAEIAPRTFFAYFPTKDDVVFHDFERKFDLVASWLRERVPGVNAIDALRAGIEDSEDELQEDEEERRLHKRLIEENDSLAAHASHLNGKFSDLLAEAVAEDLGAHPGDLEPRLVASAATAALSVMQEVADDEELEPREILDSLLAFLRGGLTALQDQSPG